LAGALVGYLAYLTNERWTGAGFMAAAAARPIGFGFYVWILREGRLGHTPSVDRSKLEAAAEAMTV